VDGVARYDFFANSFEQTLRHLFHDPSRAAQILPTEHGAEGVVRTYHELTTLARLTWNPYLYDAKLQQRLGRLRAPTLLVWGENDTVLPPAHGEAYAALLPHATLTVLPACGHLVPFERADAFAQLAVEFLTA
jgi:pimeloyl-ACP methyl ester carboxylesterase